MIYKFFLRIDHGIPSGIGDIELLGQVVFELLSHILQELEMESAFFNARHIDALHQLRQLHTLEIKEKTLIGLHLERHDDL